LHHQKARALEPTQNHSLFRISSSFFRAHLENVNGTRCRSIRFACGRSWIKSVDEVEARRDASSISFCERSKAAVENVPLVRVVVIIVVVVVVVIIIIAFPKQ
tara:strand:- start:1208 stop:1516 length:309 start_codon:yes stop_codon:yes gene_type:complete